MKKILAAAVFVTALFAAQNANGHKSEDCGTCNKGHSLKYKSVEVQTGTTTCPVCQGQKNVDCTMYKKVERCKTYNHDGSCKEYEWKDEPYNCSRCCSCGHCGGDGKIPTYSYKSYCYCSICDEYYK
jgi:hypothetical protein